MQRGPPIRAYGVAVHTDRVIGPLKRYRASSCRYLWTKAIAMLPSPTAEATRLTGLNRTSPRRVSGLLKGVEESQ